VGGNGYKKGNLLPINQIRGGGSVNHTTPRQRRLRAEHELRMATLHEAASMILGGLMMIAIFILFACL